MKIMRLLIVLCFVWGLTMPSTAQERTFGKKEQPQPKPIHPKTTPMMGDMLHVRNSKPGLLKEKIGPDAINRVRRLTIEGLLNGDDIKIIKRICDRTTCKNDNGRSIDNYVDLDLTRANFVNSYSTDRDIISNDMFSAMDHLRTIRLPEYTREIGRHAFYNCGKLETVDMPGSVRVIGDEAFSRCDRLQTIILSRSLTRIGRRAFSECKRLRHVVLPQSLTIIGEEAFRGCGLTDIHLNSQLQTLGWNALADNPLTEIYIPRNTHIDGGQPGNNPSLQQIDVEQGNREYTSVGGVLYDYDMTTLLLCPEAKNGMLNVPHGITTIAENAFAYCKLSQVVLPASVNNIEKGAFMNCAQLQQMMIPEAVNRISPSTFSGCKNLRSIHLPMHLTLIGASAFRDCVSLQGLILPNSLTTIGEHAFQECGSLTMLTIPSLVTKIPESCFRNCNGLQTVVLHNGITSIGKEAFRGCLTMTHLALPNSLLTIGDEAFRSCSAMREFVIPASVTEIGNKPFIKCEQLQRIVCRGAQPPTLKSNGSEKIPLYVPRGFASLYKKAKNWKKFKTIIEE